MIVLVRQDWAIMTVNNPMPRNLEHLLFGGPLYMKGLNIKWQAMFFGVLGGN
jgi:hypothetical protein